MLGEKEKNAMREGVRRRGRLAAITHTQTLQSSSTVIILALLTNDCFPSALFLIYQLIWDPFEPVFFHNGTTRDLIYLLSSDRNVCFLPSSIFFRCRDVIFSLLLLLVDSSFLEKTLTRFLFWLQIHYFFSPRWPLSFLLLTCRLL